MNAKDIIQLNNKERKALNEENLKIYEDMLLYIRAKSNKSEQQTEEVLLELLNHLLDAQAEGKSAADVFGEDYRSYCDEVIEEIPSESNKNTILFVSYIVMQFLAIISFMEGAVGFILYNFFDRGSSIVSFSLGSGIISILIELLVLYIFIKAIFRWITKSAFHERKTKKVLQFIQVWIFCSLVIALMVCIPMLIPSFGTTIQIPVVSFAVIGVLLYLVSFILNKKYRIIK